MILVSLNSFHHEECNDSLKTFDLSRLRGLLGWSVHGRERRDCERDTGERVREKREHERESQNCVCVWF